MQNQPLLLLFPSAARSHAMDKKLALGSTQGTEQGTWAGWMGTVELRAGGGWYLFVMDLLWAMAFCNLPGSHLRTGPTAGGVMPKGTYFPFAFAFAFLPTCYFFCMSLELRLSSQPPGCCALLLPSAPSLTMCYGYK